MLLSILPLKQESLNARTESVIEKARKLVVAVYKLLGLRSIVSIWLGFTVELSEF